MEPLNMLKNSILLLSFAVVAFWSAVFLLPIYAACLIVKCLVGHIEDLTS